MEDYYVQHSQVVSIQFFYKKFSKIFILIWLKKAKDVVLINCGATLDLIELLQPPEDAVFYIIDSLRPLEVRNVYNGIQIKIIVLQNELGIEQKSVPEFEDIFDEEDEEKDENDEEKREDEADSANEKSDGDEDDDSDRPSNKNRSKRKRFDAEYFEKQHKRREWENKR